MSVLRSVPFIFGRPLTSPSLPTPALPLSSLLIWCHPGVPRGDHRQLQGLNLMAINWVELHLTSPPDKRAICWRLKPFCLKSARLGWLMKKNVNPDWKSWAKLFPPPHFNIGCLFHPNFVGIKGRATTFLALLNGELPQCFEEGENGEPGCL